MRILAFCPHLPFPPEHGGRIRSGVMLRALAARNEVVVAAPVGASERDAAVQMTEELGVRLAELPATDSSTSPLRKIVSWARGRSDVVARRWSDDAVRIAHEVVASQKPAIVIVDTTFAGPLLPETTGARIVLGLHNVESEVLARLASGLAGRVEARLTAVFEAKLAARADFVVAVSARDAELVGRMAPGTRVEVVENTVDVRATAPLGPRPHGAPMLLFVGSFDYPPNREAARILVEQHLPVLRRVSPELRVRLVGRDPTGSVASHAAAVPGVECVGFVDDLRPEYDRATAVYVPLRTGGGTRIKVLEALAFGRPVIATALAVEGLAVERGAHFLGCDTAEEGAASLRAVLESGGEALVSAGRALVESRYDHAIAGARWRELFAR